MIRGHDYMSHTPVTQEWARELERLGYPAIPDRKLNLRERARAFAARMALKGAERSYIAASHLSAQTREISTSVRIAGYLGLGIGIWHAMGPGEAAGFFAGSGVIRHFGQEILGEMRRLEDAARWRYQTLMANLLHGVPFPEEPSVFHAYHRYADRASLADMVNATGVQWRRSTDGPFYEFRCPFEEGPEFRFRVDPETDTFDCGCCLRKGDRNAFLAELKGEKLTAVVDHLIRQPKPWSVKPGPTHSLSRTIRPPGVKAATRVMPPPRRLPPGPGRPRNPA